MKQQSIKADLEFSNLDTKTRLLKEALTKKNDEVMEVEENNQSLIELLEHQEEDKMKYEEEVEVLKLKIDKYEIQLNGKEDKIETGELDSRVTFLVNLLEEYRKRLEEDVKREKEERDQNPRGKTENVYESLLDYDDKEVYDKLTKQNSV